MRFRRYITSAAVLLTFAIASAGLADTIRVGAAISLKDAVSDVAKAYEAETGDKVQFTFGSSGQIQQQIKSGAEIDAFISAANKQVDELAKDGLIDAATRRVIVMNALVLVVPADAKDAPKSFAELADPKVAKLAVGEPKTVPAGLYAQQVLKFLKIDSQLSGRLVFGTNVRQVLTYVEQSEVSAGIVYATDALESGDKVKVVATADDSSHEPIVYPGVVVTASKHKDAATHFLDYLGSAKAQDALVARGFKLPIAAPATEPAPK